MLPGDDIAAMYGRSHGVSYGAEGGGGNGGGGQAAAVAGILEAVAGIVTGVGDVVYMGRMTESKVFTNVADYADDFDDNITDLNDLKRTTREYRSYLKDSGNLARWDNSTRAKNHAKRGTHACQRVYSGHPGAKNTGGHRWGNAACWCKTHSCAFKDPFLAEARRNWLKKGPYGGWPGGGKANPPHLHGRGIQWRLGWLKEAWTYLMTVAPAIPAWNLANPTERIQIAVEGKLTEENVLKALYPSLNGTMPIGMQDHWWNLIIAGHMAGLYPYQSPTFVVPYWVFGFKEAEVRALMPDSMKRRALFSIAYLLSLQTHYINQALAGQGVTNIYAGDSVRFGATGSGALQADASAGTMRDFIIEAAESGVDPTKGEVPSTGPAVVGFMKVNFPKKRSANPQAILEAMSDDELRANGSVAALAILAQREADVSSSEEDYVRPNYTPLVMGGLALTTSLWLRSGN